VAYKHVWPLSGEIFRYTNASKSWNPSYRLLKQLDRLQEEKTILFYSRRYKRGDDEVTKDEKDHRDRNEKSRKFPAPATAHATTSKPPHRYTEIP
jgi:hypothetical protein